MVKSDELVSNFEELKDYISTIPNTWSAMSEEERLHVARIVLRYRNI